MTESWTLAVDFGTSFTTAALVDGRGTEVLEIDGVRRFPSTVVLAGEELVVGPAAVSQAMRYPDATEAHPKQLLGVRETVLLGRRPVRVVDAVATVLGAAGEEGRRRRDGQPPASVWATHPARWDAQRTDALVAAVRQAGLGVPHLVPEPVAAALHYADRTVGEGAFVAVFDLGGGTFDTAVLQRAGSGFQLVGAPGGDMTIGGEVFDRRVYDHLLHHLGDRRPEQAEQLRTGDSPEWRRASLAMLLAAREAKEALSRQTSHTVYLPPPVDLELRVTRPDLEALIADDVERAVDELERTVERAGLDPTQLAGTFLTGGGSRIPLVARRVEDRLGRPPSTYDDPKLAVVLGASRMAELSTPPAPSAAPPVASEPSAAPPPAPEPPPPAAVAAPGPARPTEPAPGGRRSPLPLVLVLAVVLVIVAVVAAVVLTGDDGTPPTTADAGPGGGEPPVPTADDVLALVNDARSEAGLAPVRENGELAAAARVHSTEMADEDSLFHSDDLGDSVSLPVDAVGELIGEGPVEAPDQIVDGFLGDPDSRGRLLDPAFALAGVGAVARGSTLWVTVQLAQPATSPTTGSTPN